MKELKLVAVQFCSFMWAVSAWGQYTLKGIVNDFRGNPVIGASVMVKSETDSLYYKGSQTDTIGQFAVEGLEPGEYRLKVSLLGYESHSQYLKLKNTTDVGEIRLREKALNLKEVVVKAEQPATKIEGSTLVTTIAGSNLSYVGNALDVLAQLPMIKVDDNKVSVAGKKHIEIYIDGRPMRDNDELLQILSSNIKKVELITVPGAAYESTTDAVLKLTTKQNFFKGLSLTDQFNLTRRREWSLTDQLGLGYRIGGWEFFFNGSFTYDNTRVKGTTSNTLEYNGLETVVGSRQDNTYSTTAGSIKAGFNYAKGSQSFGAYYRYNPECGDFANDGAEWLGDNDYLSRYIDRNIHAHSHLASLYYENTISCKYLLHFDGDFLQSRNNSSVATTYPMSANPSVNSNDLSKSSLWAGKLYINFPLWKGDFTFGTQNSYTHTSLDYRMMNAQVSQYIPSSFTDARQTFAAVFATWARKVGRFYFSLGTRYEYVDYDFKVNSKRDSDISRYDHLLTPDISLSYSFGNDANISLSYKMATVRPPYEFMGSLSYTGLHEIEGGNPTLRDEKRHDIQLSGGWHGFMLQLDFMRSLDTYAFVKQLYPAADLQLLMHPVNINVSALNLFLMWSKSVRRWTPNITIGMYKQWLALGNTRYNKPMFLYFSNNTFSLPHGWTVTANFRGQTRGDTHTNRFGATWLTIDASVGKMFFKKQLTVKLTATDIFNTVNNDWTMNTYGVFVDKRQSTDRRGIALSLIYNFQPRKSGYKGSSAAEEEMKRL